jgi:hypothetical protein
LCEGNCSVDEDTAEISDALRLRLWFSFCCACVGVDVFEVVISFPEEDIETDWIFMTADLGDFL